MAKTCILNKRVVVYCLVVLVTTVVLVLAAALNIDSFIPCWLAIMLLAVLDDHGSLNA